MECLDDDEETSQICGLCGIIPEAVLGKNNIFFPVIATLGSSLQDGATKWYYFIRDPPTRHLPPKCGRLGTQIWLI